MKEEPRPQPFLVRRKRWGRRSILKKPPPHVPTSNRWTTSKRGLLTVLPRNRPPPLPVSSGGDAPGPDQKGVGPEEARPVRLARPWPRRSARRRRLRRRGVDGGPTVATHSRGEGLGEPPKDVGIDGAGVIHCTHCYRVQSRSGSSRAGPTSLGPFVFMFG